MNPLLFLILEPYAKNPNPRFRRQTAYIYGVQLILTCVSISLTCFTYKKLLTLYLLHLSLIRYISLSLSY